MKARSISPGGAVFDIAVHNRLNGIVSSTAAYAATQLCNQISARAESLIGDRDSHWPPAHEPEFAHQDPILTSFLPPSQNEA